MKGKYSQLKAMWAITRASLKAIFRSPQAVFFSLFFPIVLITIFSALGGNSTVEIDVAFDSGTDTSNVLYQTLKKIPVLSFTKGTKEEIEEKLKKGRITAIISIQKTTANSSGAQYDVHLKTSSASQRDL